MTQIIENKLYLGDIMDANNESFITNNNVTTIICIAKEGKIDNIKNISIYYFDIDDDIFFDLYEYFDFITKLIDERMEHEGSVLVNCICGISRSSTIIIAYLMKYCDLILKTALKEVHHVRSYILPNENFIRQLIKYEDNIFYIEKN
jgi:protein-tyrosine phosphatase